MIASVSIVFIGRRFVAVSEKKKQSEAEFRYVLTRLRENGESIAILGGEEEERSGVDKALARVRHSWRDICVQTMRTTIVSQTSSYVSGVGHRPELKQFHDRKITLERRRGGAS